MHIAELREREAVDDILAATLAAGWSAQLGHPVRVAMGPGVGQNWLLQPTVGAFLRPGASAQARRFMADTFRFSPKRWRSPAQFLLGTALASTPGLRLLARPGFHVTPPIPGAEHLVVVPGNARVRVFDLRERRVRVFLKSGFPDLLQRREIEVRTSGPGPFPPLLAFDANAVWFEEPLIDGYALPRLPPWQSRRRAEARSFALLDAWLARTATDTPVGAYVLTVAQAVSTKLAAVRKSLAWQSPALDGGIDALVRVAADLPHLRTAVGHGDFQPGNILVGKDGGVTITDWEHSSRRMLDYDRLVYGLATRAGMGLATRLRAFLRGAGRRALAGMAQDPRARRCTLALFILEDVLWFASESVGGPFRVPSRGLRHWDHAVEEILPELGG